MKRILIFVLILGLSLGLMAQKVQQQGKVVKPKKVKEKINYETKYYEIMKENDQLKYDNNLKDTKIYKLKNDIKVKKDEILRLQKANAKLNLSKNSLHSEVIKMKKEIAELKAAGNAEKYKAEIKSLKAEVARLKAENAKLKAALNQNAKKKKGKVIKVEQQ